MGHAELGHVELGHVELRSYDVGSSINDVECGRMVLRLNKRSWDTGDEEGCPNGTEIN